MSHSAMQKMRYVWPLNSTLRDSTPILSKSPDSLRRLSATPLLNRRADGRLTEMQSGVLVNSIHGLPGQTGGGKEAH